MILLSISGKMVAISYGKGKSILYIIIPENNKTSAVPRHKELKNILCTEICKALEIEKVK